MSSFFQKWIAEEKRPAPNNGGARLDHLRRLISGNAILTREYVVMNFLATVVAAYGLIQNSTAVVIGAMLIAMLLGPINGVALALNDGNITLLRRSIFAEGVGVAIVFVTGLAIGRIHDSLPIGSEILTRTQPNILDLIIALAGGMAGAYAIISPRLKVGAVGVAIATTLLPPVAAAGILIARGGSENLLLAGGALLLFLTNLVTIQAAASVVFWFSGLRAPLRSPDAGFAEVFRRHWVSVLMLGTLGVVLFITFQSNIHDTAVRADLRSRLQSLLASQHKGANLADVNFRKFERSINVYAVVRSPHSFGPEQVASIERGMQIEGERPVRVFVRSVITKEASRDGWLNVPTAPDSVETPQVTEFPGEEPTAPISGEVRDEVPTPDQPENAEDLDSSD